MTLQPIKAGSEVLINYGEYAPENMDDFTPILEPIEPSEQATTEPTQSTNIDTEIKGVETEVTKLEQEARTFI